MCVRCDGMCVGCTRDLREIARAREMRVRFFGDLTQPPGALCARFAINLLSSSVELPMPASASRYYALLLIFMTRQYQYNFYDE